MYVQPTTAVRQEERIWGMLAHLLSLLGYFGFIAQYLAPLVVYMIYRNQSKFVAFHALQSLYFQLLLLAVAVGYFFVGILTCGALFALLPVAGPAFVVAGTLYTIFAAIKAHEGEWFEYVIVGRLARRHVGLA
jgi:hypothetical protein